MKKRKTQIFENEDLFFDRKDTSINGVSKEFAEKHPNWEADNETNRGCWNCLRCSDCDDCRECKDCKGSTLCVESWDCSNCIGCLYSSGSVNCSQCVRCNYCFGCSLSSDCDSCHNSTLSINCNRCDDCSHCSFCKDCKNCTSCYKCSFSKNVSDNHFNKKNELLIPIVKNIHNEVLKVTDYGRLLEMDYETSLTNGGYCRRLWVLFLGGKLATQLSDKTSPEFAAMMIYKASSPIIVPTWRYNDNNTIALEDIKSCAILEKELADRAEEIRLDVGIMAPAMLTIKNISKTNTNE